MTDLSEYVERKLATLKPSEQRFIRAAREDGVYWRGEDIEHFKLVYEETQKMRKVGVQSYREESIKRLKRLFGKMT